MSGEGKSLLPWGVQEMKPGSLKTISDNKLATFATGQVKKSRFQKAREEAEERKRQDQIEAAKAYEVFAASFDATESDKAFVRGGTVQSGNAGVSPTNQTGDVYKMESAAQQSRIVRSNKPLSEMEKIMVEMKASQIILFSTVFDL
jgi:hypothetical protein